MPLNLLGKKSWNVYNKANIDKVRRDEADAAARQEEADRIRDAYDAECRLALLRGEPPPSPPPQLDAAAPRADSRPRDPANSEPPGQRTGRKRRKLAGEDDTSHAIRVAREDEEARRARLESASEAGERGRGQRRARTSDAPITDTAGHINLFPVDERAAGKAVRGAKNAEHEAEKARRAQEFEDQYTMRFANAAGRGGVGGRAWYEPRTAARGAREGELLEVPEVNVFGRQDVGVVDRAKKRIESADPLALMSKGLAQKKKSDSARKAWAEEQAREIESLKRDERESESSHRHPHRSSSSHPHRRHRHRRRSRSSRSRSPRREDRAGDHRSERRSGHHHHHHQRDQRRDRDCD